MTNATGQTIRVSCASTRPEQFELIRQLFMPYGHIILNGPYKTGRISIQCLLNMTFGFLLPKKDDIPDWILQDRNTFLSFLGGYSDAEAHIGISGNKASFRLSTADQNLISKLSDKLAELDIQGPKPYIWLSAGSINSQGAVTKKNIWRPGIYRADSLLRLLQMLVPYLQHAKRRRDALKVLEFLDR